MQKIFLGICSVNKHSKKHLLFEHCFHWLNSLVKDWHVILSVSCFLKEFLLILTVYSYLCCV